MSMSEINPSRISLSNRISLSDGNIRRDAFDEDKDEQKSPYNLPFNHLSTDQRAMVDQFRAALSKNENDLTTDYDVIRFLGARCWNVDEAVKMKKDSLKMRRLYQFDRFFINDDKPRGKVAVLLNNLICTGIDNMCYGTDKTGNPVSFAFFGEFISLPLYKYISIDEYIRWHLCMFEKMVKQMGKNKSAQFLFIVDLNGLTLESRHNAHFIRAVGSINEVMYPEYFYKVICVNAPKYIQVLYSLVKMTLPQQTKGKVSFFTAKQTPNMMQRILKKDSYPKRYGGSIDDFKCFTQCNCDIMPLKQWRNVNNKPQNVINVKILAREKKIKVIECKKRSVVKWWFKVKKNNILFSVRWKNESESDKEKWIVVREAIKCGNEGYGSYRFPVYDEYKTNGAGQIEFEFSNKYSRMYSKSIDYQIQCVECNE